MGTTRVEGAGQHLLRLAAFGFFVLVSLHMVNLLQVPFLQREAAAPVPQTSGFLKALPVLAQKAQDRNPDHDDDHRLYTLQVLDKIAGPVLENLSKGTLRSSIPMEGKRRYPPRGGSNPSPLEAFGRTVAGIAPWLELGAKKKEGAPQEETAGPPVSSFEQSLLEKYQDLTFEALKVGTDPESVDFLDFDKTKQALVDTAFLALGLLRAPTALWSRLSSAEQERVLECLKMPRPHYGKQYTNNWLLFPAMIEAALWEFGSSGSSLSSSAPPPSPSFQLDPIEYAIEKHMDWYLGDGIYGDGENFHWDHYNSYVIQPMLLEIFEVLQRKEHPLAAKYYKLVKGRAMRYAEVQERLISPEGTFPVVGRSSAYRFGAFHHLSVMSLKHLLPKKLHQQPSAVRAALTAVVKKVMKAPNTFDDQGWLRIGAVGYQPSIGEDYITTGSLYLCTVGLLHLGLPPTNAFWNDDAIDWTQKKIWSGTVEIPADHARSERRGGGGSKKEAKKLTRIVEKGT